MQPESVLLDAQSHSSQVQSVRQRLKARTIGQDAAVDVYARVLETFFAGYTDPLRPVSIILELGPTGTGKTTLVENLCEILFGNPQAYVKINCAEYHESQQTNRMVGAPPGYIGYKEKNTDSDFAQEKLDAHHAPDLKLTVVLLDEIEKAHQDFYLYLLNIFNDGEANVSGTKTNFRNCLFVMTSNLGSGAITQSMGFGKEGLEELNLKNGKVIDKAVKAHFPAEFINRIDHQIVFQALSEQNIGKILEVELTKIRKRILDNPKSQISYTFNLQTSAKQEVVRRGFHPEYGARPLRRVLQRVVVDHLAIMIRTGQIEHGDLVSIGFENGEFTYSKYYASTINGLSDPQWEDFKSVIV